MENHQDHVCSDILDKTLCCFLDEDDEKYEEDEKEDEEEEGESPYEKDVKKQREMTDKILPKVDILI